MRDQRDKIAVGFGGVLCPLQLVYGVLQGVALGRNGAGENPLAAQCGQQLPQQPATAEHHHAGSHKGGPNEACHALELLAFFHTLAHHHLVTGLGQCFNQGMQRLARRCIVHTGQQLQGVNFFIGSDGCLQRLHLLVAFQAAALRAVLQQCQAADEQIALQLQRLGINLAYLQAGQLQHRGLVLRLR